MWKLKGNWLFGSIDAKKLTFWVHWCTTFSFKIVYQCASICDFIDKFLTISYVFVSWLEASDWQLDIYANPAQISFMWKQSKFLVALQPIVINKVIPLKKKGNYNM